MFLGQYAHTLDEKFRLALPAKFRARLADGIVITTGTGKCLHVHPVADFQAIYNKVSALPLLDEEAANVRRKLFNSAHDVVPDKQNRIVIPQALREYAEITNEVIVAGAGPLIELWNPAEHQRAQQMVREQGERPNGWKSLGI
jgi:MraZ protein